MFHNGRSGRVDLTRTGNTVTARTRGIKEFTLLLSPDQFDFDKNVKVIVNGRVAFDGARREERRTLTKWAARDNDRTMLFGAELKITPLTRFRSFCACSNFGSSFTAVCNSAIASGFRPCLLEDRRRAASAPRPASSTFGSGSCDRYFRA